MANFQPPPPPTPPAEILLRLHGEFHPGFAQLVNLVNCTRVSGVNSMFLLFLLVSVSIVFKLSFVYLLYAFIYTYNILMAKKLRIHRIRKFCFENNVKHFNKKKFKLSTKHLVLILFVQNLILFLYFIQKRCI